MDERQCLTLSGSKKIILELFNYAINCILFQRGVYPPHMFKKKIYYQVSLMILDDPQFIDYFKKMFADVEEWLEKQNINKFVLLIIKNLTNEVVERWEFKLTYYKNDSATENKSDSIVRLEIQNLIRQITASVSFLPLLNFSCSIDILVYVNKSSEVLDSWSDSLPKHVLDAELMPLRSVSTNIHRVDASVSYKIFSE
ncbi:Mitotic spindle assembly checkpoint protein MAD2A [Thelohanellus kitauei]|uniref:Mitotic spindle assembly checkpoint protein MAD2A n=1 Tax=Thelohanellus kitauei TaxID=669202 RepID=A0A0C2NKY5_THEKT|nr:Mitotic spindle assembly checkpoint protein MAD2A [Thelohanellus kitauei]